MICCFWDNSEQISYLWLSARLQYLQSISSGDNKVFVFHKEWFQLHASYECQETIENVNSFLPSAAIVADGYCHQSLLPAGRLGIWLSVRLSIQTMLPL